MSDLARTPTEITTETGECPQRDAVKASLIACQRANLGNGPILDKATTATWLSAFELKGIRDPQIIVDAFLEYIAGAEFFPRPCNIIGIARRMMREQSKTRPEAVEEPLEPLTPEELAERRSLVRQLWARLESKGWASRRMPKVVRDDDYVSPSDDEIRETRQRLDEQKRQLREVA